MPSNEPAPASYREPADAVVLARAKPVRLGALTIDPAMRRVVRDDGQEAFLQPRVMQVLVALVRTDGKILSRDDLMAQCWSGMVVGEDAINRVMAHLRRLSEGPGAGIFRVETITKVGYRLVRTDFAPEEPRGKQSGNLPRRVESLIGRVAEVQDVLDLLGGADLVTITGTGGVGKSRLALEAASRLAGSFEDGVWLVELAPTADPKQVAGAVARAMRMELPIGDHAGDTLVERVKRRHSLIILDNCEHLIDATAALAEAILERSSTVKLLATSQEALRVGGERVYSLRSLTDADAAQLFVERARAADANVSSPEASAAAIAAICRRLDGLPLAIEMAAARAPQLGCDAVLERLDRRFQLLTGGRRTALPRQRTLIATLDWSHDLLPEREAAVFRRLGVFSGGFSLDAATTVCASEGWDGIEITEAVADLVAKSLVAPEASWGARRYRLLETTRTYALEKLAASGEAPERRRRHADYFRQLAGQSFMDHHVRPVSDDAFAARYFGEVDNILRAREWAFGPDGDVQIGIALTVDATALMGAWSLDADSMVWVERAATQLDSETPVALRARLFGVRASGYIWVSPTKTAELAPQAIEVCRVDGDAVNVHHALWAQAVAMVKSGRSEELGPIVAEMVALLDHLPSPSRLSAITNYWVWRTAFILDPETAPVDPLDTTIAELRSFGAVGETIFYRCWRLFYYAPSDISLVVEGWRTLLADLSRSHYYSGLAGPLIVGQLMTALAQRRGQGDLDEAMEFGRRHARIDIVFEGFHTTAGLAWVALNARRLEVAARLAGRLGKISAGLGNVAFERNLFNILLAALQAELTEVALSALMTDGASLSAEDARLLVLGASGAF